MIKQLAAYLAYSVSLFEFRHHYDAATSLFPDHSPEVAKRLRQWTLRNKVAICYSNSQQKFETPQPCTQMQRAKKYKKESAVGS